MWMWQRLPNTCTCILTVVYFCIASSAKFDKDMSPFDNEFSRYLINPLDESQENKMEYTGKDREDKQIIKQNNYSHHSVPNEEMKQEQNCSG